MAPAEKFANLRAFQQAIEFPRKDGSTPNAPLLLAIEATTRCNFRCVHCSQGYTKEPPADLSLELFQSVVPLARTAHEVYLFGDGEVLLDIPRHLAMMARIYQEDPECQLGFSTNGKLLTPEVYELYSAAGIRYIQLSIDAATKDLYEAMRRGGSFDRLLSNLDGIISVRRRSEARQPQLRLATVISKQNYRQLPMLAEFAAKYEFSYWYINAECPHNPGRDLLRLAPEDLAELEEIRADIAQSYSQTYSAVFDPCIGLSSGANDPWLESESAVYCTVPWQMFIVKANGDAKICPYFDGHIRSLNERSFAGIWNGDEYRQIRRAFASGNGLPARCASCNRGLRKQYLRGYPGIPDPPRAGALERIIRWISD